MLRVLETRDSESFWNQRREVSGNGDAAGAGVYLLSFREQFENGALEKTDRGGGVDLSVDTGSDLTVLQLSNLHVE